MEIEAYSSEPRWVIQGVTEPAQGVQRPPYADQFVGCAEMARKLQDAVSCCSSTKYACKRMVKTSDIAHSLCNP